MRADNHPDNQEAGAVAAKFDVPHANVVIGESNTDTVAFTYMNSEGILYWLPRFFAYIRTVSPVDSWHSEAMLFRLGDPDRGADLRAHALPEEVQMVQDYLEWYRDHPGFAGREDMHARAVAQWVKSNEGHGP